MWAKHYFVLSTDKLIFTEQQEKEEEPEKEDEPEVTHSFCSLAMVCTTHMTVTWQSHESCIYIYWSHDSHMTCSPQIPCTELHLKEK